MEANEAYYAPKIGLRELHSPGWRVGHGLISPLSPALQVHRILQRSNVTDSMPFYFDITKPPSNIIFYDPLRTPSAVLLEKASQPSMSRMELVVPTITGKRIPTVVARNSQGVTVLDILTAIYDALHAPLTGSASVTDEQRYTPPAPRRWRPRSRSYEARTPTLDDNVPHPRRIGDQLGGHTIFAGLEEHPNAPNVWIVRTSKSG